MLQIHVNTAPNEVDVYKYADAQLLVDDIRKVDEIYLWFVKSKERDRRFGGADSPPSR